MCRETLPLHLSPEKLLKLAEKITADADIIGARPDLQEAYAALAIAIQFLPDYNA